MGQLALISLAFMASALGACGGERDTGSPNAEPSGPLVTYARSGGIAGMPVELTVEADGQARVRAGIEGGQPAAFALGAAELDRLRRTLEAADLAAVQPSTEPSTCADCFSYEVTYEGRTASYVEIDEVPSSVSAAVSELDRIAGEHVPAGLAPPG